MALCFIQKRLPVLVVGISAHGLCALLLELLRNLRLRLYVLDDVLGIPVLDQDACTSRVSGAHRLVTRNAANA